ncbi:Taurine catabolism dioxygenase TauD TfdA family protein [Aspergillus parasiticus SU-1]|uniref:Taurine catabolism dioxygenase TauD TfdA family protein n=1 Tax=Aspergillus parasiticus (strain ATCC 56775 / NRRL 5862 / SRRC 143 / SU-1) TaxID=1403190 RepID=A0A0F0IG65_ASPPU|nr:Taurine catabolism dioxygenase TauD TfdA family protein [Aspergillus parasiticus SU-1]
MSVAVQTLVQPDIQYHPDYEKYTARRARRQATEQLSKTLPEGFPQKLESPLVWEGKDVEKRDDWIYRLNDAQREEIDAALKSFQAQNLSLGNINQDTFPLPTLRPTLRSLSNEIHNGRGFFVLRGLDIDRYTREENIIIYAGVSSHIGSIRGRQEDRRYTPGGGSVVLSHIKDLTRTSAANAIGAPSNTADKQVFHTDSGDIISLLCLHPAAEGGESQISSSWLVYNILAKERPDLIRTLSEPWPVDGFNDPEKPYTTRPLLYHQKATDTTPERVLIQYARRYFTGFLAQPRSTNIPPISEAQAEALDALHFLAEEHSAALDFQKGDVQYINNLSIFHARKGFRDEPDKERHLLRLWLRDPENAWATPEPLRERWENVYGNVKVEEQIFPLEPKLRKTVDVDFERKDALPTQEIEYLYLELETPLPTPRITLPPGPNQSPAPECPDMKQYISPFLWPKWRKTMMTWISCGVTALAGYSAGEVSPASTELTAKWGISSVVYNLSITIFCIGFALAPMVLAPFSELNGRRPIFVVSGVVFTACIIACGGTHLFAGLLVARFFQGVGASTFSTMVGGVISDIYHAEDRNTPMALFSGAALFGTGLAPLLCSVIVYHTTWRWIYYSHAIVSAVFVLIIFFFFKETRGSVILSRKAQALNKYYEALEDAGHFGVIMADESGEKQLTKRIRWKVKSDEQRASLGQMISISLYRPFHMLFTEPVVFFFSLWAAFSWAVLYLQFGSVPLIFQTNHGFNVEQSGAVFTSMCVAVIIATLISIYQERVVSRFVKLPNTPEKRLYFACVQAVLMPAGLFWFGWSSYPSVHWIAPALAVGCATMGILSIYLAVFNYLADTYHRFASSAIAAQSCCRNLLGGVFPLVTHALFTNLGYPAASSLLGGIGAALTLVPWVLSFYGAKIRAKSKLASELAH